MSEIAIRNNDQAIDLHDGNDAVNQLARWAQAADAAYQMARKLTTTTFVPQQYRGKPEEATAAILAGAELGLGPMAALRSFHNIQGTPAASAMTLRAIVQSKGHEVKVLESTPERATVAGRRAGDDDWQTSTWDINRARAMGLMEKNPQYRKQPAAMLVARATAEVCRWIASDAIMGMPYSTEELRDQDGDPEQARPRPMRVTTADILGQTEAIASVDPGPQWAEPTGDVEPDTDPVDALLADSTQLIDERQKRRIFALLGERGITDRAARLDGISKVIGRPVGSTNDLTADEAEQVITSLTAIRPAPEAEPPADDDMPF